MKLKSLILHKANNIMVFSSDRCIQIKHIFNLQSAKAVNGVSSDGFNTMVQPAARAGPTLRVIIAAGKFQGVIKPTGPRCMYMCKCICTYVCAYI
jgi:hypothetical protein